MKTVKVREWKDLTKKERDQALKDEINGLVDAEMEMLEFDRAEGRITEDEYYKSLGCDKYYAETTAWFVPSCYYEKHEKDLKEHALGNCKQAIYDKCGKAIWTL